VTTAAIPASNYDALVIGGGIGGLVAACYLARAGARTLLLEAGETFGGCTEIAGIAEGVRAPLLAHTLYALDPRAIRELKLDYHGLAFAERDMKTVALRPSGVPIVLPGVTLFGQGGMAGFAEPDAAAYGAFRRNAHAFARRLRPLWNASKEYVEHDSRPFALDTAARRLRLSARETDRLSQLTCLSAVSLLDRSFENDALKAALSFDAGIGGVSPGEAGSALTLLWRFAQEGCRVQGAVSQQRSGKGNLAGALVSAATDLRVELRNGASVTAILVEDGRAAGVALASGEILRACVVVSNLDARRTLFGLVPQYAIGFGAAASVPEAARIAEAKLVFVLDGLPPFAGLERELLRGRLIVAPRPESATEAKGAAFAGHLPAELVMEVTVPTMADAALAPGGSHVVSALVRYLPVAPVGGWATWRGTLRKRVVSALDDYAPGFADRIAAVEVLTPEDIALRYGGTPGGLASPFSRLLASYGERVRTPLPGLFLCGSGAEPVDAISGRAGRLAAAHARAELRNVKRDGDKQ